MSRTLPPPEASAMGGGPAPVRFPGPCPAHSLIRGYPRLRTKLPAPRAPGLASVSAGAGGHWRGGRLSLGWVVEAGCTGAEGVLTDARSPRGHSRGADRLRIGGGG